jgi:hypothetical protein
MSANIYRGGIIGGEPADTYWPYKSGIWGVGEAGMTYNDWLQTTPAFLSSADVWLDASDLSTITEAGGAVSQWDNKGTLGNFTQGTAALQPTTGSTTLNSRNVLDFASDYLTSADTAATYKFLHDGTDHIIAAVLKPGIVANPDSFYSFFGNNAASASFDGFAWAWDDRASASANELWSHFVSKGDGTLNPVLNRTGNAFAAANTFGIVTTLADPNNGTAADRSAHFYNSGSAVKNNTATGAPSGSDPDYVVQIGAGGNNIFTLTGSIAELIVVSGDLATETNRVVIRDYLNAKWTVY